MMHGAAAAGFHYDSMEMCSAVTVLLGAVCTAPSRLADAAGSRAGGPARIGRTAVYIVWICKSLPKVRFGWPARHIYKHKNQQMFQKKKKKKKKKKTSPALKKKKTNPKKKKKKNIRKSEKKQNKNKKIYKKD
eukprot:NODE_4824_length_1841_cov_7.830805.p2 GENE.NODE_4824_length_1841_cov_7.830805~~NODE_4824_length_1841_cov_7.830805.p2  ORF type:complete len:133 (+),score=48.05 NODE_4824_length_1841_cov_7.830805:1433-1831(+)